MSEMATPKPSPFAYRACPICALPIPNRDHAGQYSGAVSREDDETEICGACGEAQTQFETRAEVRAYSIGKDRGMIVARLMAEGPPVDTE